MEGNEVDPVEETTKELVIKASPTELSKSIDSFSYPLAQYLGSLGLPIENVLYSIEERKKIINSLEQALDILPIDDRAKAYYLTKFTVAVSVGLFDGALNYLWDETIGALRRLVLKFDLQYFFAVAEKVSSRYRNLSSPDHLDQIQDHDLLESCRRIGLLSDINYRRLEHVNFMRNHASAAHPTDHEIDGFEMLGWLATCLRYAIIAEPDHSVIVIKQLIDNIRTVTIPARDIESIGNDIAKQPQERIDDLLWTIFGMYVDPGMNATAKSNIQGLASHVWQVTSEDRKYEVGAKFGVYRKNAEVARKDSTQEFLEIVKGVGYKDEDSLAGEIIEELEALKTAHFGFNNFYNEYPYAKALKYLLPLTGKIPRSSRTMWVKTISICFIGNGLGYYEGVDKGALPYYEEYSDNFTEAETVEFIKLFQDPEFNTPLVRSKCDRRARELADKLKKKHKNVHVQKALDEIIKCPVGRLDKLAATAPYKTVLANLPTQS